MSGLIVNPSTTIWGIVMGLCSEITHVSSQSESAYIGGIWQTCEIAAALALVFYTYQVANEATTR